MIVFPAAILWSASRLVTLPMDGDFLCKHPSLLSLPHGKQIADIRRMTVVHVYPGIFTLAGLGHGAWVLSKVTRSWSQTIRDKEFLVEMRLRNLEEQEAADNAAKADARQVAAAAAAVAAADAEGDGEGDGEGEGEGED